MTVFSLWFVDFVQHERGPGRKATAAEELLLVVDGGLYSPGTRV